MSLINVTHLRPLTMGEILDRAIRLYRRNFANFIGLAALIQIPATLLTLLLQGWPESSFAQLPRAENPEAVAGQMAVVGLLTIVVLIIAWVWGQFGSAAFIRMATDTYLDQPIGVFAAIRKLGYSWLALLSATLWSLLFALLAAVIMIIPCVGWLLAVPGIGMLIFATAVVMQLVAPIVVLERLGGRKALRRAWDLARQRFWWLLGFFLLLGLFSVLVTQGPLWLITGAIGFASGELFLNPSWLTVVQLAIGGLIGVLYLPIPSACLLLVYFDTRIRHEGLDLALQTLDEHNPDPETIFRQVPPSPEPRLIVGGEWGKFIGLALVVGGLYLGLVFLIVGMAGGMSSLLS